MPPRDPELARKFDQDKEIERAPILLPCFGPGGFNPVCFLVGAVEGFDFKMESYAHFQPRQACPPELSRRRLVPMAPSNGGPC